MVDLSITIYTCCVSFFLFINKYLKETAFDYYAHWSGADDQKIDFSIISIGAVSTPIMASTRRNGFHKKECTEGRK